MLKELREILPVVLAEELVGEPDDYRHNAG